MASRRYFLLSAFGKDRSGIVAGITRALLDLGANIEDASMTRLGGEFSMMLVAGISSKTPTARWSKTFAPLRRSLGVDVTLKPIPNKLAFAHKREDAVALISVYGTDRPGIVHEVARLLARHKINITDLNT